VALIRKAIILAAGKGTRMGARTSEIPKPMLALAGKPMIEHVLDRLREAGIHEALLVVGHLGGQIQRHLAGYPMRLEFREQVTLDGTARAALLARGFAGPDPFLLTFGDILCAPEDYRELMEKLDESTQAVLGVKDVDDPCAGAAVYVDNGRVTGIVEKPRPGSSTTRWNSAGVYAFQPVVFAELEQAPLSPRGEYELTSAIGQMIGAGRLVRIHAIERPWLDVGRPEDLAKAERMIQGTVEQS
jgi:dTDP-glucose pyrophosphorylase